jgi:hypothetical protein
MDTEILRRERSLIEGMMKNRNFDDESPQGVCHIRSELFCPLFISLIFCPIYKGNEVSCTGA